MPSGSFDVKNFGKGYGEENDFCRRAAEAGWRNLHALDTFVLHTGGVSFGDSKSQREIDAVSKMRRLHPSYDALVHDFVDADPARPARLAVDLARVRSSQRPSVLAVVHNRGGGTLRHAIELAHHLGDRAIFFLLTPIAGPRGLPRTAGTRCRLQARIRFAGPVALAAAGVAGAADIACPLPPRARARRRGAGTGRATGRVMGFHRP